MEKITNPLQLAIHDVFKKNFGYTPFKERMDDISREFFELMKWRDVKDIEKEGGDLFCSLMELMTESGWDIEKVVKNTLDKINTREKQYKSLGRKFKIALFGGAFDMTTNGHIEVAKFVLNTSGEFDEVWLVPAYKHMYNKPMVSAEHRINMGNLAAQVDRRIKIFDYEIKNELSGETYNLFKRLAVENELTEMYNFSMVIGLDNANTFDKWVNYESLERMTRFVVIPRKGVEPDPNVSWYLKPPHIYLTGENHIPEISSTYVKKLIKDYREKPDQELEFFILQNINENVFKYIMDNNLYL
jgi:nicotinate-nucleotide adenylyltransferase